MNVWTFVIWTVLMLAIVVLAIRHARKSKKLDAEAELIASSALPEIGGIAERKYEERYGRPPTSPSISGSSWYPSPGHKRA
jgi:hypothetical protein